jgi:nucleoside phosphorylase
MECEIPRFSEEDLKNVIKSQTPRAQPQKGTKLSANLQRFCKEVQIILHTVNNNEKWAVLNYMKPPEICPGKPLTDKVIDLHEPNWIVLGMFGGYKCAMIQTKMGADSHNEVEDALDEFPNARVIVALGVAYACNPDKAKYGDVLVSKVIDGVGNVKHTSEGLIICRASSTRLTPVSPILEHIFARGEETWSVYKDFRCTKSNREGNAGRQSKVHSGNIISDKVLIDNKEIRDKMTSNTPEVIGGEMEGVSLVEIQKRHARKKAIPRDFDVIVIKGVADYADGRKDKKWQFTAAMAAADYVNHKLELTEGRSFEIDSSQSSVMNWWWCTLLVPVVLVLVLFLWQHLLSSSSILTSATSAILNTISSALMVVPSLPSYCDKKNNPPKNLPKLTNPFHGRESNMSYLEQALSSGSVQVLGINGPPGFGKSTVAIHLGWRMVNHCFKVGYIDMEGRSEIFSYALEIFNEKRLAEWSPPLELAADGYTDSNAVIARGILDWFEGKVAILIIDNCNHILSDEKQRKNFVKFLQEMIQFNSEGKIVITSDEKFNLVSLNFKYLHFTVKNLSVEASIKVLQEYSPTINEKDAKEIAIQVENCPIALTVIGGLLNMSFERPSKIIRMLNDRKDALKVLNSTEFEKLNFLALMDVVFDLLKVREQISAMFFSFFPKNFASETAAQIIFQSSNEYSIHFMNKTNAIKSIGLLYVKSLLEKLYYGEVERYNMHRLIKYYFMDKGDRYGDHKMEVEFNNSFRIYFTNLQLRHQPLEETREKVESELLSDYDRHNFYYLNEMLLSNYKSHMYSEDELVYLAFSFYKGLINFDYRDFQTLLNKFTSPGLHVATLPESWEWSEENFKKISKDFINFFTNVLCNVTSKDICINVYLDLLYKVYKSENCSDTYEDTFEKICHMVDCYDAQKYFDILDRLNAFEKCENADFCRVLLTVRYMCTTFEYLKIPAQNFLMTFMLFVCIGLVVLVVSCCKVKELPILLLKHFCLLILIYVSVVGFTYTRFLRKHFGLVFDAPVEIHTRNTFAILLMLAHNFIAIFSILIKLFLGFYISY